ncbi:MAG: flavodoxin [Candidatus Nanoarchaeia archaeon]|nr:flavodoxin [Candidatus Nanoarchaeia archaeon]
MKKKTKPKKSENKKKRILVVFYSRSGNTKNVGNEIASILNADICEIESQHYNGILGYIKAGYQAVKKKKPLIRFSKNPDNYDTIIIGTPNWGSAMASPVRTFIEGREFISPAYFCLQGGSGGEKILKDFEQLCGKPLATMIINDPELKTDIHKNKINEFCEKIKQN